MKNFMKKIGAALVGFMAFGSANAEIAAADLAGITTSVTTDVGTVTTWALGLLAVILAAVIGFTLVSKFGKKAAN